ncbi:MAG: glycosyltransferase family 4 protein [Solirubrobacteraceae bacterium]|jgi:glycosyltransferase involved in cell wall biosynthesis
MPEERSGEPAPPRVLVITQNCPVPSDRRVWNELRALQQAGYEVVAICPEGDERNSGRFERRDGVEIFRYPPVHASGSALSYLREYAMAFWHIRRLARKVAGERGFDVVQASNPPDFLLLSVRFLKRRGACFVFDHHDLAPELYLARFGEGRGIFFRLALVLEWLNFRLTDLVIATNESYRQVAIRRGGRRVEDVFVVRSGPELARFQPVPGDPALKRGREHLISFIGEMAPQDGLDHAIRALAHLRELREDWHAVLAGDGPSLAGLRELTDQLGLNDHVEFAGWLEDPELRTLLCSSDVCLAPDPKTRLSDASTLVKVAEYMAMARPVVAYELTETKVTADGAAIYAGANQPRAFARAIADLLDDPQRRLAMGRIGRERVEASLSWEHSRVALLAAYEAALRRQPATRASGRRRLRTLARHVG